jgi:hypothetical protein
MKIETMIKMRDVLDELSELMHISVIEDLLESGLVKVEADKPGFYVSCVCYICHGPAKTGYYAFDGNAICYKCANKYGDMEYLEKEINRKDKEMHKGG